jgi:hypothetical protein
VPHGAAGWVWLARSATVSSVLCLTGQNPEIQKLSMVDPANPAEGLVILSDEESNFADGGLGPALFGASGGMALYATCLGSRV